MGQREKYTLIFMCAAYYEGIHYIIGSGCAYSVGGLVGRHFTGKLEYGRTRLSYVGWVAPRVRF